MRIRKNSRNPPHASGVEPHVCQLNQSPWDVSLLDSPPTHHHQFLREERCSNGNESLGDSIDGLESVWSIMNGGSSDNYPAATADDMVLDDNEVVGERELVRLSGGAAAGAGDSKKLRGGGGKAGGKRGKKGPAAAGDPYEFYYYSGFGPSWGRKRRGGGEMVTSRSSTVSSVGGVSNDTAPSSTSSVIGNKSNLESDCVDNDDEDEDGDSGRKWRKKRPVKSRSLKSLM